LHRTGFEKLKNEIIENVSVIWFLGYQKFVVIKSIKWDEKATKTGRKSKCT